jgi:hypothetical protein
VSAFRFLFLVGIYRLRGGDDEGKTRNMKTPNHPIDPSRQWPDFYTILNTPPSTDPEALRQAINTLHQQANRQSDHRELSTRFYNQVLSEKVLPQCRRILLNTQARAAYDEQLRLHREGAQDALSYHEFVVEITRTHTVSGALGLSLDELAILPSVGGAPPASSLMSLQTQTSQRVTVRIPTTGEDSSISIAVASPASSVSSASSSPNNLPAAPPAPVATSSILAPRKNPLMLAGLGAVALALLAGGWVATRGSGTDAGAPPVVPAAKTPQMAPVPAKGDHPLLPLNTLAVNADFELSNTSSWTNSGEGIFAERPPGDPAKSGNWVMTFYLPKPFKVSASQTISGLKPGKYTLTAWTRRSGGQNQVAMFADGYGGPKRTAGMPSTFVWTQVVLRDISVSNGKCVIGFSCDSPAKKWMSVDAIEFHKQ